MKPRTHQPFSVSVTLLLLLGTGCASLSTKASRAGETTKRNRDAPIIYVAFGDSTGIGMGGKNGGYAHLILARIKQKYPGSQLINRSNAWATTAEVSKEMKRLPVAEATLVTISLGVNDLMQGVSDEQFGRNYEDIVTTLEKTGTRIIITNLPNISLAPAVAKSNQQEMTSALALFNRRIEEIAKRHELPLVDLYQISSSVVRSHPESISADGFHPSDVGYELWAESMWPIVEKALDQ